MLYIVDLSNWKDGFQTTIWISFVLISFFVLWDYTTLTSMSTTSMSMTASAWISREEGVDYVDNVDYVDINTKHNDYDNDNGDNGDTSGSGSGSGGLWIRLESWSLFLFSILNLVAKLIFFFVMVRERYTFYVLRFKMVEMSFFFGYN